MSRGQQEPAIIIAGGAGNTGNIAGPDSGTVDNSGIGGGGGEQPRLIIVDPASVSGGDGGSQPDTSGSGAGEPRRRGRPRGSSNARSAAPGKKAALNVNAVEAILFSGHAMLAGIVQTPELMIGKDEAHDLAEAIAGVARHYDMDVPAKSLDWANLAMVVGRIEGTRVVALMNNRRNGKSAPRPAPTAATPAQPAPANDGGGETITIPGLAPFRRG